MLTRTQHGGTSPSTRTRASSVKNSRRCRPPCTRRSCASTSMSSNWCAHACSNTVTLAGRAGVDIDRCGLVYVSPPAQEKQQCLEFLAQQVASLHDSVSCAASKADTEVEGSSDLPNWAKVGVKMLWNAFADGHSELSEQAVDRLKVHKGTIRLLTEPTGQQVLTKAPTYPPSSFTWTATPARHPPGRC